MKIAYGCLIAALVCVAARGAEMTSPAMETRNDWVRRHLLQAGQQAKAPFVQVMYNHGGIGIDAVGGEKLKIGDKQYDRGLYVHAASCVLVRLPSAGKSFSADVGIRHWSDTAGGKGSVIFKLLVGEKEVYHNRFRPHQGLGNRPPGVREDPGPLRSEIDPKSVQCQSWLGGLLTHYERKAA
jgi:hypothetical protein